jgi:exodeoxyribonuclease-3
MKIATWNVNSLRVRLAQLLDWLAVEGPDIVGLQETKLSDDEFPAEALHGAGYRAIYAGQKTYNGVALLSRIEAEDVETELPGFEDPQRRVLAGTYGELRVIDLYVPNGQAVGSEKYVYKLAWLAALGPFLAAQLERYPRLVVMGDFNIAPEDRDVHDPAAWEEAIMCSTPERAAFQQLLDVGLVDAFRRLESGEGHFTWWDYRAAAFRRGRGLRIDHILVSRDLGKRLTDCRILRDLRGLERPSDHAAVMAEFNDQ